jgi:BON domain
MNMNTPTSHLDIYDAELITRIGIALNLQQSHSLRNLTYNVEHGVVTVRGRVASYHERQLTLQVIQHIVGVEAVHDELEIAATQDVSSASAFELRPLEHVVHSAQRSSLLLTAAFRFVAGLLFVAGMSICFGGCSQNTSAALAVVEGQITYNGQPLPHAFVVLHPKHQPAEQAVAARGTTDATGIFQATSVKERQGVPTGDYLVTVQHFPVKQGEIGTNVLSPKIASARTTDIEVRVNAGTNKLSPIEVRR